MSKPALLTVALCCVFAAGAAQPAPAPAPALAALVDATIIDPGRGFEATGMTVLIESGRVKDVFPTGERPLEPDTEVHPLDGSFLLPGLIDSHKHLTAIFHRESPERMYAVLERMARSGIVAMRDMAGDARLVGHVADLAAAGEIEAPEIYYSAVVGSPHFAAADPRMVRAGRGFEPGEAAWAQALTQASDLKHAMTRAEAIGVTGLKVYLGLDADLLRRLTAEAHREGLKVWSHATPYPLRPLDAVRAGVDSISHACGLAWQDPRLDPAQYTEVSIRNRPTFDPERVDPSGEAMQTLFSEMARRGTIFDPTLSGHARPGDDPFGCTTELTVTLAREAQEAGVEFVAGTDYETPEEGPFPALFLELQHLVDQRILTPRQALSAATLNAARLLGLDERLGSVEPGKVASFVVLAEDPGEDIRALRSVTATVHRGTVVPRPSPGR